MPEEPTPVASPEDHRKHLDFIQTAIGRMSASSAVAKGWALTIAVATYGYAGTKHSALVALLGMFATLLFAAVDARYLREERKYRMLFEAACKREAQLYEMNATRFCKTLAQGDRKSISWPSILRSWSIRDYYGITFLVGVGIIVWIHCQG